MTDDIDNEPDDIFTELNDRYNDLTAEDNYVSIRKSNILEARLELEEAIRIIGERCPAAVRLIRSATNSIMKYHNW